jgi:hypothetical protein
MTLCSVLEAVALLERVSSRQTQSRVLHRIQIFGLCTVSRYLPELAISCEVEIWWFHFLDTASKSLRIKHHLCSLKELQFVFNIPGLQFEASCSRSYMITYLDEDLNETHCMMENE